MERGKNEKPAHEEIKAFRSLVLCGRMGKHLKTKKFDDIPVGGGEKLH